MSIHKIINIFIVFLSVFVFSIDYNTLSKIEYENMNNLIDTIGRNEELDILQLELEKKDESFFNDLIQYITNKGNTTIISRSTQNSDLSINQNYYLYTKDTDKTLSSIYIRNNKKINFDNKNEEYYSTNLKEECYDHIDYLNKNYHKSYNHIIHMYQLNRLSKDDSKDSSYYVYIYTNNKDETIKEIENSKLNRYLSENWKNNEYTKIVSSNYDDSLSLKFLMISSITILLLYICETIKVKKEIMVRKMFGMGNIYIITKLFLKGFIRNSSVYLVTYITCFFIVIGHLRSVTHNFLISQAKFLLIFTLFQIVLYFIIYLFISCLLYTSRDTKITMRHIYNIINKLFRNRFI